jgi:hypothetical protein
VSRGRKAAIGDVLELDVGAGKAYLQLINRNDEYGPLIRVLPGIYETRPDLESLSKGGDAFLTFFPVDAALSRGIVRRLGSFDVPKERRSFPAFKIPGGISPSGEILNWWIWDGKDERRVDELTEEQLDLPVAEIVNDTALRERISSGWRHRDAGRYGAASEDRQEDNVTFGTTHFAYFADPAVARPAAVRLEEFGHVEIEHPSDAKDATLIRVLTPDADECEAIRRVVEQLGGEYDGTETAVG